MLYSAQHGNQHKDDFAWIIVFIVFSPQNNGTHVKVILYVCCGRVAVATRHKKTLSEFYCESPTIRATI